MQPQKIFIKLSAVNFQPSAMNSFFKTAYIFWFRCIGPCFRQNNGHKTYSSAARFFANANYVTLEFV